MGRESVAGTRLYKRAGPLKRSSQNKEIVHVAVHVLETRVVNRIRLRGVNSGRQMGGSPEAGDGC